MFILELTLRSWSHSEENKRRTLQRNDIAAAITRTDVFDFLVRHQTSVSGCSASTSYTGSFDIPPPSPAPTSSTAWCTITFVSCDRAHSGSDNHKQSAEPVCVPAQHECRSSQVCTMFVVLILA